MICGCNKKEVKNYSHYYNYTTTNYEIQSYNYIDDNKKQLIESVFRDVMEYMKQYELKQKFIVKIFYNKIAYNSYKKKKNFEIDHSSIASTIRQGDLPPEILIPKDHFSYYVLTHEMVHAIRYSNDLVFSDGESYAYFVSDELEKRKFND